MDDADGGYLMALAAEMHKWCKQTYPEGLKNKRFVSIWLGQRVDGEPEFELRVFHGKWGDGSTELSLFREPQRYARFTLIIYANGSYHREMSGVLPDFDLMKGEVLIPADATEHVMRTIYAALQAVVEGDR